MKTKKDIRKPRDKVVEMLKAGSSLEDFTSFEHFTVQCIIRKSESLAQLQTYHDMNFYLNWQARQGEVNQRSSQEDQGNFGGAGHWI